MRKWEQVSHVYQDPIPGRERDAVWQQQKVWLHQGKLLRQLWRSPPTDGPRAASNYAAINKKQPVNAADSIQTKKYQ